MSKVKYLFRYWSVVLIHYADDSFKTEGPKCIPKLEKHIWVGAVSALTVAVSITEGNVR